MRIAFITSEFAGLPESGGIGSYFRYAARSLANAGHEIEVFTSGQPGQLSEEKGIRFHHLGTGVSPEFAVHAAEALVVRHREAPFDLLESAEFKAEGLIAARALPDIAQVVRVHSPSVLLDRYLDLPPSRWERLMRPVRQVRAALAALKRGLPVPPIYLEPRPPSWFPNQDREERAVAAAADLVLVMNQEMRRFARDYWWIKDEAIRQVSNPFQAPKKVSSPCATEPTEFIMGFAGRLEPRKGILELAQALKQVLPRNPNWKVELAGRAIPSCLSGADVGEIARKELKSFGTRVQFLGPLPSSEMGDFLAKLDLCVFPSHWETFHYAVLEAMAAGKAIVATRTGAVTEMLDEGRAGLLVDPGNASQLAEALGALMRDLERRKALGFAAQERMRTHYSEAVLTPLILEAYQMAVERRNRRLRDRQK